MKAEEVQVLLEKCGVRARDIERVFESENQKSDVVLDPGELAEAFTEYVTSRLESGKPSPELLDIVERMRAQAFPIDPVALPSRPSNPGQKWRQRRAPSRNPTIEGPADTEGQGHTAPDRAHHTSAEGAGPDAGPGPRTGMVPAKPAPAAGTIIRVRLSAVIPNPFRDLKLNQLRDEKVKELVRSIGQHHLWDPLRVRHHRGAYQLVAGHHRLAALRKVHGEDHVGDFKLVELDDSGMLEQMVEENSPAWKSDFLTVIEAVQGAVQGYSRGTLKPQAPGRSAKLSDIRHAPGFIRGAPAPEGQPARPYTAYTLANALGWLKPSREPQERVLVALHALELQERRAIAASDLRGRSICQVRGYLRRVEQSIGHKSSTPLGTSVEPEVRDPPSPLVLKTRSIAKYQQRINAELESLLATSTEDRGALCQLESQDRVEIENLFLSMHSGRDLLTMLGERLGLGSTNRVIKPTSHE